MKKTLTLSLGKAILFGTIINIIVSGVISTYSFDIINAFGEEPIAATRGNVMVTIFPASFIILTSVLIAYTFLSIVPKKKED
ncbi:MAG: hypothetical protein IJ193_02920 [Bacilli bacterium]|nr:hypothetical protein [Bacilli bacterium]